MKAAATATLLGAIFVAGVSTVAAQQAPAINAQAIFDARCKGCHEPGGGRTPNRDAMKSMTYEDIAETLTAGAMVPMAAGLSPAEITALSRFLGGRSAEIQAPPPPAAAAPGRAGGAPGRAGAPTPPPTIKAASPSVVTSLLGRLRPITDAILKNPTDGNWMHWGRNYEGQNYSPLTQINRENVKNLVPAWRAPLAAGSNMPSPLVYDGVMFFQTTPDTVLALDAATGELLWRYAHTSTSGAGSGGSKHGLAISGSKVFVGTADVSVVALDIKTGQKLWDSIIAPSPPSTARQHTLRSAPLVVGDKVIQGVNGMNAPGGNYIVGMDVNTGKELWRFHTIARPGQPGGDSWNDLPLDKRSGGSVWHQGSYDEESGLVYFGVSQTYDTRVLAQAPVRAGVTTDALYTDSTVALDPKTGNLVWHYQHLKNDQWDMDWVFERTVANVRVNGRNRRAVMTIGKIGILDAVDAKTGQYLFSVDTGVQNFITGIDPVTGEKRIDPTKLPDTTKTSLICPTASGARSWPTTSFSARTNMVYVPVTEWCMTMGPEGRQLMTAPGSALAMANHPEAISDKMQGRLTALDLSGKKIAWKHDLLAPLSSAVLTTGSGLAFVIDLKPNLMAFDDRDGKLLWTQPLDNIATSAIITYSVGAKQYLAVVTGQRNNYSGDLTRSQTLFRQTTGMPAVTPPSGQPAIQVFALPSR